MKIASSFLQTFSNTQRVLYLKSAIDLRLIIPLFYLFADVTQSQKSHVGEKCVTSPKNVCVGS